MIILLSVLEQPSLNVLGSLLKDLQGVRRISSPSLQKKSAMEPRTDSVIENSSYLSRIYYILPCMHLSNQPRKGDARSHVKIGDGNFNPLALTEK